ncbi:hypothetical protein [Desulfobacula sp.]|uniref:hypothetical protein n=1 Tax=Desulfobacula sp. TaxID=2593537 RepID=UPI00262B5F15|nr:hypothetical protein [Desulfobacula sp.]
MKHAVQRQDGLKSFFYKQDSLFGQKVVPIGYPTTLDGQPTCRNIKGCCNKPVSENPGTDSYPSTY